MEFEKEIEKYDKLLKTVEKSRKVQLRKDYDE